MPEKLLMVIGVTTFCMLSPGPDMALVMRNALTRGRRHGAFTAAGVLAGNLVHISYCALGIGLLLTQSGVAYNALRLASAGYLLYLAIQGLRHSGGTLAAASGATSSPPGSNVFAQGLLNNLLNPKGILFYVGVFSYLITPDMASGQIAILIFVMMAVSAAFWVLFLQTLQFPAFRSLVDQYEIAVHRAFGVVLILLAIRLAVFD